MTPKLSLDTLPIEILYEIHHYAASQELPLVCRHLYAVFKFAPSSVHAEYLLRRCHTGNPASLISLVLRYPLCTQSVIEAILRSPACPPSVQKDRQLPLELPRRLFRTLAPRPSGTPLHNRHRRQSREGWSENDHPLPFLRYLYDHPRFPAPDTNAHDGYALTRAVHAGFMPLVRFLLENGASPAYKDGLAVMVAIRQKDLSMVRLLIERDGRQRVGATAERRGKADADTEPRGIAAMDAELARKRGGAQAQGAISAKKRRLEDRMTATPAMLKMAVKSGAQDIANYLVQEKGCVPDMRTIDLLGYARGS
ncbi:hypothetical protein WOLCODRAFT_132263 [Wolfiporia cocos MD-104 SS10]|uniref:Ankyrin n=1 Tax=Wolfiporia cocos (strain MD-104) TaxID=742152 RepID=A0A2H3JWL1_WOLCO|nr:hypothetical protein WOLCODRAFT_132263 [Wolfiporia cocos MD-104 SS10]